MNMREQFKRVPNNHLIKKLNICNIPLSESEEYDIYMAYLVLNCILNKSFFPWSKTILTLYTLSKLLGFIIIIIILLHSSPVSSWSSIFSQMFKGYRCESGMALL